MNSFIKLKLQKDVHSDFLLLKIGFSLTISKIKFTNKFSGGVSLEEKWEGGKELYRKYYIEKSCKGFI